MEVTTDEILCLSSHERDGATSVMEVTYCENVIQDPIGLSIF